MFMYLESAADNYVASHFGGGGSRDLNIPFPSPFDVYLPHLLFSIMNIYSPPSFYG